MLEEIGILLW